MSEAETDLPTQFTLILKLFVVWSSIQCLKCGAVLQVHRGINLGIKKPFWIVSDDWMIMLSITTLFWLTFWLLCLVIYEKLGLLMLIYFVIVLNGAAITLTWSVYCTSFLFFRQIRNQTTNSEFLTNLQRYLWQLGYLSMARMGYSFTISLLLITNCATNSAKLRGTARLWLQRQNRTP